jgi:hypothetical protein
LESVSPLNEKNDSLQTKINAIILQQEETKWTEKEDMVMYLLNTNDNLEKQNSNLQKENQKIE